MGHFNPTPGWGTLERLASLETRVKAVENAMKQTKKSGKLRTLWQSPKFQMFAIASLFMASLWGNLNPEQKAKALAGWFGAALKLATGGF